MFTIITPLLALLAAAIPADTDIGRGPEPSLHPISWEFDFAYLDPRRIEVQVPGTHEVEVYWYMVYTVTNTSRHGQRFFPTFQIVTEDLRVLNTDVGISPLVFEAIAERHRTTHKYLVHPTKALGALLTGPDYARESVAIWRASDVNLNKFRIYVEGLSGETRFIPNPAYDPEQPETATVPGPDGEPVEIVVNPRHFTLRKTLEIPYTLPGSPQARQNVLPERGEVRWVMR